MPLINELRHGMPQVQLDVLATPLTAPLLEPVPAIDRVQLEPREKLFGSRFFALVRWLRQQHYSGVIILRPSLTMAMACKLANIAVRLGFDKQRYGPLGYKRWGLGLTKTVAYPSLRATQHQLHYYAQFLTALNLPLRPQSLQLQLWSQPEDLAWAEQALSDISKPLAILHAATASHGKTVPVEKFKATVEQLLQQGYCVICTGTAAEHGQYQTFDNHPNLYNWAGKTTLAQLVALFRHARVLVSIDSASIHIGAAVGIEQIMGVYGPTNETLWGVIQPNVRFQPVFLSLPCRPCYAKTCAHNRCKVDIELPTL